MQGRFIEALFLIPLDSLLYSTRYIREVFTSFEVKISPRESEIKRLKELSGQIGLKDCKMISKNYSEIEGVIYAFML